MRALVTGAGGRLGAAMALGLARSGYDVALHFNASADGAAETAARVESSGRHAAILHADLLDEAACDALVPRAAQALGGALDLLVNNAAIFERDDLANATSAGWDRHFGVDLRAPFLLTQAFAAQVPPAGDDGEPLSTSAIVNIVDQSVRNPTSDFMTYTLAKSALWTLTRTSAQALAPATRVNAIAPGPTLRASRQSAAHFAAQRAGTVLGRGANVDDICEALRYLVGAKAVTGQMIFVDGGQHLAPAASAPSKAP